MEYTKRHVHFTGDKKFRCWLKGHSWRYKHSFKGGETFECRYCEKTFTSFCYCPSYESWRDFPMYVSALPLWKRILKFFTN